MAIAKYNKGRKFTHNINTEGFKYLRLKDLEVGSEYLIRAIYGNEGKFGKQFVLLTDTCFINAPLHMNDTLEDIVADKEAVAEINEGVAGIRVTEYSNDFGTFKTIEFIEL